MPRFLIKSDFYRPDFDSQVRRDHPRVIATNHNAGITAQSTARLDRRTVSQVIDVLQGRVPPHLLNPEALSHPRQRPLAASDP